MWKFQKRRGINISLLSPLNYNKAYSEIILHIIGVMLRWRAVNGCRNWFGRECAESAPAPRASP